MTEYEFQCQKCGVWLSFEDVFIQFPCLCQKCGQKYVEFINNEFAPNPPKVRNKQ